MAHVLVVLYACWMDMWGRIRTARALAGLSKSELARRVGVSPAAATQWEGGGERPTGRPTDANIQAIAKACGVSYSWLATGEGHPRETRPVFQEQEIALMLKLQKLPPDVRRAIEEQIDALSRALSVPPTPPRSDPEQES